jgi:Autophagy-related protein 101
VAEIAWWERGEAWWRRQLRPRLQVSAKSLGDVSYPRIEDESVLSTVEAAVRRLQGALDPSGAPITATLSASLYTRRERSSMLGLGTQLERVFFERWNAPIRVSSESDADIVVVAPAAAAGGGGGGAVDDGGGEGGGGGGGGGEEVRKTLLRIAVVASASLAHVPAFDLRLPSPLPFGFECNVTTDASRGRSSSGATPTDFLGRLMRAGPPSLTSATSRV